MSIYGNIFKPVAPEDTTQLMESLNTEVIQEATELGLYTEAKFHLFKVGDSSEYKDINKDLKDAEQILNSNGEELDVNKVGSALLHSTDAVVSAINAGTSAASIVNPVFIPVALGAKLVSVATKSGKEAEALKFADDAITKLEDIKAGTEDEALIERINNVITKLQKSKHTLEVGKKTVKKEEKAVKKEEKAAEKAEKKEAKEEKKALKTAAKAVKKNKVTDDDNEDDDEDVISQVESSNLMEEFINFCSKEGIELNESNSQIVSNILEGECDNGKCDDKNDNDLDENDRDEVNDKIAEELTTKKESAIYTAFRALMSEATDEQIDAFLSNINEASKDQREYIKQHADYDEGIQKMIGSTVDPKGRYNDDGNNSTRHADYKTLNKYYDTVDKAENKGQNAVEKYEEKLNKKADKLDEKHDNFKISDNKYDEKLDKLGDKRDKKEENEIKKYEKIKDKAADKAANDFFKEKEARAANERWNKLHGKITNESVEVEDLFNFVVENSVEITEDLYNKFVEAGLIEAAEPEFESYEEFVNYCLENGIQKTKEELEAIKESFIKEGCCKDKSECDSNENDDKEEKEVKKED